MKSLEALMESCTQLKSVFNVNLKQSSFVTLEIRDEIVKMNELCTTEFLTTVSGKLYGQAAKARLLIGNDIDQLGKSIEMLAREDSSKTAFDSVRRDIVRMAGDLSSDADSLLEILRRQFNDSPIANGKTPFKAILSDC